MLFHCNLKLGGGFGERKTYNKVYYTNQGGGHLLTPPLKKGELGA